MQSPTGTSSFDAFPNPTNIDTSPTWEVINERAQRKICPEIAALLTSLREYLEREYQDRLDRMILFGSQARGDTTPTSDVDVLIVLQDPVEASTELDRTSQFIAQLCLERNTLISRLFMPRSRFETENSPFLRNIRREGIML
jgi:predicted nucleotidyltransferase